MGLRKFNPRTTMEDHEPTESLTFDQIEKAVTPDIVAARCDQYTFKGKPLKPFTKTRQTAAVTMGTRCFLGIEERDSNGSYPEILLDAQKIVWLCAVDDGAVKRACRQPVTAIDLVLAWWEENGGDIGSAVYSDLMEIFTSILTDLRTVSAEIDQTGSRSSGESLGE